MLSNSSEPKVLRGSMGRRNLLPFSAAICSLDFPKSQRWLRAISSPDLSCVTTGMLRSWEPSEESITAGSDHVAPSSSERTATIRDPGSRW